MTALVSAVFTLTYGVLFRLTDGSIDALFWSLFAFSSIVFLLPYVVMALAFPRCARSTGRHPAVRGAGRRVGAAVGRPGRGLLVAAVVFFVSTRSPSSTPPPPG